MATTPNINLSLTASSESGKLFHEWRTSIDGLNANSNMEKIDTAFGDVATSIENAISESTEYTDEKLKGMQKWVFSATLPSGMLVGDIWNEEVS